MILHLGSGGMNIGRINNVCHGYERGIGDTRVMFVDAVDQ